MQHLRKTLKQRFAGWFVCFGCGQGEEVEVRLSMQIQSALHHVHGLLVLTGTS